MNYPFRSILLATGTETDTKVVLPSISETQPHTSYTSLMTLSNSSWLNLKLKQGNLLCRVFYRPPSSKSSVLTLLECTTQEIPPAQANSLALLSDFNIHLCKPNHPLQLHLNSVRDKLNLQQVVSDPIRSTSSTDTLTDFAYISDPSVLTPCTIEPPLDGSNHCSLILSLCLSVPRKVRQKVRL